MRAADLIREARLRAGLTQYELAERSGSERSVIARWEQGAVSPSVEKLVELIEACGFDLPLELVPRDTALDERLEENGAAHARAAAQRLLQAAARGRSVAERQAAFDPYAILAALERQRVTYVLIGGLARVIQGTEEITHGLDLAPSLRAENLRRLGLALDELDASAVDGKRDRRSRRRRSASSR